MKPGISVVIPSFNRATSLPRAISSALGQTRPPDEVIVVDDASTDNTRELLANCPTVRYVYSAKNLGAAGARNLGVRLAHHAVIAFLDSDDAWLADKLERQYAELNRMAQPGLIITGLTVQARSGKCECFLPPVDRDSTNWGFRQLQTYPFSPTTWLLPKHVLERYQGFDESLGNCEDLDLLARMVSDIPVHGIASPLVVKFNLEDSLDADFEKTRRSMEQLFARYPDMWQRQPRAKVASLNRLARMSIRQGRPEQAQEILWSGVHWDRGHWPLLALAICLRVSRRLYLRLARRLGV